MKQTLYSATVCTMMFSTSEAIPLTVYGGYSLAVGWVQCMLHRGLIADHCPASFVFELVNKDFGILVMTAYLQGCS